MSCQFEPVTVVKSTHKACSQMYRLKQTTFKNVLSVSKYQ